MDVPLFRPSTVKDSLLMMLSRLGVSTPGVFRAKEEMEKLQNARSLEQISAFLASWKNQMAGGDPASPHQPKFKHFRHAITSSLEKTEALSFSSSATSIPVFPALYRLSYTCYTSFLPVSTMTGYSQLWKRLSPRQLNLAIQIFCKFHLLSFSYFLLLAIALLA
jgi:hypothetical protein